MKKISLFFITLILLLSISISISNLSACSCNWEGPFLVVSKDSPLVILCKITRHHPGKSPAMTVLVEKTLKGGILDSALLVQMGDGMHCRPTLENFPPGSRWILALNGPGSKPGIGYALSHCGEYWLKVENDEVIGSIDGNMSQIKKMPIDNFKKKFKYPKFKVKFRGHVKRGESFQKNFGNSFEFILKPFFGGWEIVIKEFGIDENIARLTPPFHFIPNPRYIEGWHLMENPEVCTMREYDAERGPENPRNFIFSPEVGRTIGGSEGQKQVTPDEIGEIERFGRGTLKIEKFKLIPKENGCPDIEFLDFTVSLEGGY